MIIDADTNFVYFSGNLKKRKEYKDAYSGITAVLDKHNIRYGFLKGTKDIWCRDYMPVQKSRKRFVQLGYEPSYLQDAPELKTDYFSVLEDNNINAEFCPLAIDRGNIVKWYDKVIMTTRVFRENCRKPNNITLKMISDYLEAEVYIIPDIKYDLTGHADGHVRFYREDTILVNELAGEYKYWQKGFRKMVEKSGLKYIEIPWFVHKNRNHPYNAIGCYVNFLEVGDLIILPVFEVPGNRDQEAVDLFESLYPERYVEPININAIGYEGGLMNCLSWNILR